LKLAVAATAPLGADVLERLARKHDIEFLLTRPDRPRGRGQRVGAPSAKEAALRLGIPVRQVERLDESFTLDGADTIVVVAYGALIPSSLLDRANWLNVHPSRLPRWRGAAPIERAIMAGDEVSAVSVIRLVEELDAGPIGASRDLSIGGDRTAGEVYAEVARLAPALIDEALANDSFSPQAGEPTYAEKIGPADRELDWSRPAKELHDRIRALSPHIGARGEVEGRRVIVWRSRLDDGRLELLEVQPEGGTRMPYEAWLRGLRSRP
jgi:methionyl-tRNA formyltransferase